MPSAEAIPIAVLLTLKRDACAPTLDSDFSTILPMDLPVSLPAIRCALATGRPFVAPVSSPWFTERQADAVASVVEKRGRRMPETSGSGWEPPHRAQLLGKSVMISLSQRS